MDLQLAMKEMEESKTFRKAMSILLAMGNTLSGTEVGVFPNIPAKSLKQRLIPGFYRSKASNWITYPRHPK